MIVNVQGPVFQRFTGNEDPDTFDIIRIEILLRAFSDNSIELCREHKDELLDAAIDKLKSSVKFRNFGVPINSKFGFPSRISLHFLLQHIIIPAKLQQT